LLLTSLGSQTSMNPSIAACGSGNSIKVLEEFFGAFIYLDGDRAAEIVTAAASGIPSRAEDGIIKDTGCGTALIATAADTVLRQLRTLAAVLRRGTNQSGLAKVGFSRGLFLEASQIEKHNLVFQVV